ncbi:MAG TPA: hypothetical protein VFD48_15330 [Pyrinomonadaceae bacterium]|nr:hypothetical protein [Pyrinomonadaceae bacterium]
MPSMYCPQCGRELNLDSGDVRFCRYCGFLLTDTKEALQGYSKQKRTGFSVVTWSYALLLIVTLLLHGGYLPIASGWAYWVPAILIVVSVSLFVSAAVSAMKPQLFSRSFRGRKEELDKRHSTKELNAGSPADLPLGRRESVPSVTEATTKKLV